MTDICLLGSGATMPTPERGLSAAILRCEGRAILFDCGEGTQCALRRRHFSPVKIDLIALSHYHGDHIFGLPGLLQTMSCMERQSPLYITGPEGLRQAMEPVMSLAGVQCYDIVLLCGDSISLSELHRAWPAGAQLSPIPARHRIAAQGYRFFLPRPPKFDPDRAKALGVPVAEWKGLIARPDSFVTVDGREVYGHELLGKARRGISVVFSGDTMPCPEMENAARDADLLIHEATYGDDADVDQAITYGHSTFRQAAELAARAGARRLWLTHFSQMLRCPEDYMGFAAAFPGAVCGHDGLEISLSFGEI